MHEFSSLLNWTICCASTRIVGVRQLPLVCNAQPGAAISEMPRPTQLSSLPEWFRIRSIAAVLGPTPATAASASSDGRPCRLSPEHSKGIAGKDKRGAVTDGFACLYLVLNTPMMQSNQASLGGVVGRHCANVFIGLVNVVFHDVRSYQFELRQHHCMKRRGSQV
jgi:hypothetical protein